MQNSKDISKPKNKKKAGYRVPKGLSKKIIKLISKAKSEPKWMRVFRLQALKNFQKLKMPGFGPDLSKINFDDIYYYIKPSDKTYNSWDKVPGHIKKIFEQLGIPKAEKEIFAGVGGQYDSENVYHHLDRAEKDKGVVFCDIETALKKHPDLVKKYFAKVIPADDNKFAALNSACWSGGSFIYVPPGVKVEKPLQAYFRINARNLGQFERTLIIADKGSQVSYIEGCSAPIYINSSLHVAVAEIIAKPNSNVRYTSIQNWSRNVYNLVTKRAIAFKNATVDWVDCNFGSGVSMKYPSVILKDKGATTSVLSMALACQSQYQDSGAKVIHLAPKTRSRIVSKSIVKSGGKASFRGLVKAKKGAYGLKSKVECHSLMLDNKSQANSYPSIENQEKNVTIEHEAYVSKVSKEQMFYLRSRGLSKKQASLMIINGFIEPVLKELPLEYMVEAERLLELQIS